MDNSATKKTKKKRRPNTGICEIYDETWPVVIDGVKLWSKDLSDYLDWQLATGGKSVSEFEHLARTGYFKKHPVTKADIERIVNAN